jgi:hypothetical protein
MWVVRIEPLNPNENLRTHECPKCEHTETVPVKRA